MPRINFSRQGRNTLLGAIQNIGVTTPIAAEGTWNQFQANYTRNGYLPISGPSATSLSVSTFSNNIPRLENENIAISDGERIYLGSISAAPNAYVVALSLDGSTELWSTQFDERDSVEDSLFVDDSFVYAVGHGDTGGTVYKYDKTDGTLIDSTNNAYFFDSNQSIINYQNRFYNADERVYFEIDRNSLDDEVIFTESFGGEIEHAQTESYIFITYGSDLIRYNRDGTGRVDSGVDVEESKFAISPDESLLFVQNEDMASDDAISAVDTETLNIVWQDTSAFYNSPPVADEETVYAFAEVPGTSVVVALDISTGAVQWTSSVFGGLVSLNSNMAITDDYLVVPADDLYFLDKDDGSEIASYAISDNLGDGLCVTEEAIVVGDPNAEEYIIVN